MLFFFVFAFDANFPLEIGQKWPLFSKLPKLPQIWGNCCLKSKSKYQLPELCWLQSQICFLSLEIGFVWGMGSIWITILCAINFNGKFAEQIFFSLETSCKTKSNKKVSWFTFKVFQKSKFNFSCRFVWQKTKCNRKTSILFEFNGFLSNKFDM